MIDVMEVTKPTAGIQSTIGKATELLRYDGADDYTTGTILMVNFLRRTVKDIPNGKDYFYTVLDLIFNGVRPDTWLTPEDADRETRNL